MGVNSLPEIGSLPLLFDSVIFRCKLFCVSLYVVNRPRMLPSRTAAPGTKLNERLNPDLTQNHNLQRYPREDVRHASFRPRERVFFHKATTLEQAHSRNTKLGGLPERHLAHQSWPPIGGRGRCIRGACLGDKIHRRGQNPGHTTGKQVCRRHCGRSLLLLGGPCP